MTSAAAKTVTDSLVKSSMWSHFRVQKDLKDLAATRASTALMVFRVQWDPWVFRDRMEPSDPKVLQDPRATEDPSDSTGTSDHKDFQDPEVVLGFQGLPDRLLH